MTHQFLRNDAIPVLGRLRLGLQLQEVRCAQAGAGQAQIQERTLLVSVLNVSYVWTVGLP